MFSFLDFPDRKLSHKDRTATTATATTTTATVLTIAANKTMKDTIAGSKDPSLWTVGQAGDLDCFAASQKLTHTIPQSRGERRGYYSEAQNENQSCMIRPSLNRTIVSSYMTYPINTSTSQHKVTRKSQHI